MLKVLFLLLNFFTSVLEQITHIGHRYQSRSIVLYLYDWHRCVLLPGNGDNNL
jgi:hypothetical protein